MFRPQNEGMTTTRIRSALPLLALSLGYFMVILDATVVNVALPSLGRDLGGGVSGLQWVVDGYTLVFAGLLLSAGSLGDLLGGRRVFEAGLWLFTLASAACGLAPSVPRAGGGPSAPGPGGCAARAELAGPAARRLFRRRRPGEGGGSVGRRGRSGSRLRPDHRWRAGGGPELARGVLRERARGPGGPGAGRPATCRRAPTRATAGWTHSARSPRCSRSASSRSG